jgi:hypothetical protein
MDIVAQLESCANELAVAAKNLADCLGDAEVSSSSASDRRFSSSSTTSRLRTPPEILPGSHGARHSVLANAWRIQSLMMEPADFLQHLAIQSQLIACLKWLGDFQVLACIPTTGSVSIRDVAHLSAVPQAQLSHVIRMTATAGFLREPEAGQVAHTTVSAQFASRPLFRDAARFLTESVAPAALHMPAHTRRLHDLGHLDDSTSVYSLALSNGFQSFQQECEQRPKLERQWASYLQLTGNTGENTMEVLTRLDWSNLGSACVVEAGAQSTELASTLADIYPALHFVVQINTSRPPGVNKRKRAQSIPKASSVGRDLPLQGNLSSGRITVQSRPVGTPQAVQDAAVYILHLPSSLSVSTLPTSRPSPSPASLSDVPSRSLSTRIVTELRTHLGVLSTSIHPTLILIPHLMLPAPGSLDPRAEATARMHDLTLFQLTNDRELEVSELTDLVGSVGDSFGRLVVVNELRHRNNLTAALAVKYQPYTSTLTNDLVQPTLDDHIAMRKAGIIISDAPDSIIEW